MQGILYVSHGSRIPEATAEAMSCIHAVRNKADVPLQEICFLEIADPTPEQGVDSLVNQGATSISVVPVLLLSAGHYEQDIPDEMRRLMAKYPDIGFTYGRPLGVQDRIINVLADRIDETGKPIRSDARILLVGRGSRSPQTTKDIRLIGEKLKNKVAIPVDVSFLAACEPSFEQRLHALSKETRQLIVVPYLWFTGVLMRYIDAEIRELNNNGEDIILCKQLGEHPAMCDALKERVDESLERKLTGSAW